MVMPSLLILLSDFLSLTLIKEIPRDRLRMGKDNTTIIEKWEIF